MRQTILYIAMSVDGFIADAQGGVDWLCGESSTQDTENTGYAAFLQNIDTVIMGRRTYEQIVTDLSPDTWPYDGLVTYVITHQSAPAHDGIYFTNETPTALVQRLQKTSGKDIWICGGATIAQQLLHDHLIDRLHLTLIPTLLGSGIRLFDTLNTAQPLHLVATHTANGMVELIYDKR